MVDPSNSAELRTYHHIYEEAERAELADAAVYSLEDTVTVLTRAPLGWFYRGYAVFESGRMVGEGLIVGSTEDNLRTARLWAWVPPRERGRGVGRCVAVFLLGECRILGRDILQSTAKYPFEHRDDHPYRRFAERHGFNLANTQVERRLALPVSDRLLTSVAARAREKHRGYRLRTIVGPIPSDVAQGYCDVNNRLALEAPGGELHVEQNRRTPQILADQDEEIHEQGRTRVTTLALDAEGTVVALSCAIVTSASEPHVDQWSTIVRADHRGHRLGLAIKVAQIKVIQQQFPSKRFITTTNAETNAHMVAVNEALGFERFALEGDFQRILSPIDA
ncbi:MAG: hypothetical protein WKF76_03990 [Nocardioidaceae bacterium]